MKKPFYIILWFLIISYNSLAQYGGQYTYSFLDIPSHAHAAALGGINITSSNNDVNMFGNNPALLDSTLDQHISISYWDFYAHTYASQATYAHTFNTLGTLGFRLGYINHGKIKGYDENGTETTPFNASDFEFVISKSHQINPFSLGVNMKLVGSSIAYASALALMLDIGGTFRHPTQDLTIALVFKNIGITLKEFSSTSKSTTPFNLQIGASLKPTHMPIRFSLTAHTLNKKEIIFYDPSISQSKPNFFDHVISHLIFGTEILIHKNFNINLGINPLVRKELQIQQKAALSGFSAGFLIKTKRFNLAYTRTWHYITNGNNYITLSSNLKTFLKKNNN